MAAASRTRAPAPDSAARRRPLGNPTARWAARSRAVPASAPPDGDDGAPRWGRLCLASGSVDHWPRSRLLWLSMAGTVQGGGEGGATPGGGVGGRGGGHTWGGRRCDAATPCILIAVRRFLQRGRGSYIGNDGRRSNDSQKLTEGVSILRPYQHPPKRHNLPLGLGGGGGRI
jgi:hypothetical protein